MPPYQPPRWQAPRRHGLQLPLSRDQVGAMVFYPLLSIAFYILAGFYLPPPYIPVVLGIYTALVLISITCWCYVSLVDPSQPGGLPCRCMKFTQGHSRYCASCRKSVPGLDHHCLWLNTCIGTRNYFFFFLLAMTGTVQFALQTAISVLWLTSWLNGDSKGSAYVARAIERTLGGREASFKAFMVVHTVVAGIAFLSFSSLCVFHAYLQSKGLGTYDWILRQRAPPASTSTTAPAAGTGTGTTAATRALPSTTNTNTAAKNTPPATATAMSTATSTSSNGSVPPKPPSSEAGAPSSGQQQPPSQYTTTKMDGDTHTHTPPAAVVVGDLEAGEGGRQGIREEAAEVKEIVSNGT